MKNIIILMFLFLVIQSCDTEDVLPGVNVELESETISEDNGLVLVTATLNGSVSNDITIPLQFSGTADINSDYSVSSNNISINSGDTTGSVTISALDDEGIESPEDIIIGINPTNDYLLSSSNQLILTILDDDTDSDGDGVADSDDNCPEVSGEPENNGCPWLGFIVNEVLYDPPSGIVGDANGDGTRDANEDEFIEFYNSGLEIDLSGYTISDSSQLRHTFPSGSIIPSNGVLVLFGGGNPSGNFGNSVVQTASEGSINMSNAGDFITMNNNQGNTFLTIDIEPLSNNPNESYTLTPDIFGTSFEQHSLVVDSNGSLFSPGKKTDGSDF